MSIRDSLIRGLKVVSKVLDTHKSNNKLYNEVMGLVWNLPGYWPEDVTTEIIPHILHALKLATNYKKTNTALGALLIVMPNVNLTHIEFMLDSKIVNLLLEMKQRDYITDEVSKSVFLLSVPVFMFSQAQNRLWKTFVWLGKHKKGQTILAELVFRGLAGFPLTELDRIKIARALSIQNGNVLFIHLAKIM